MIKSVDLHSHSIFSDGRANLRQIEEKSQRDQFSVVLTDHNEIRGSIKLYERGRIVTLLALEAGTKEGLEFLIYFRTVEDIESFYKRAIEPYKRERFMVQIGVPTETLLRIANEYECFVSLAHPFGFRKKSIHFHKSNFKLISTVYQHIDAVETYNGNLSDINNFKANKLFEKYADLKSTVGSDGHDLDSLGQVTADFQIVNEEFNPDILYDLLKGGKFIENTKNRISKINTALNISYLHSQYFLDKGDSLEKRIMSQ